MHRLLFSILFLALLSGLVLLSSCSDDETTAPSAPEPPAILGQDVSGIDHQGATLSGWVDGHGRPTVCWFDYGTDITYGARTPDLDAGAVAGPVRVEHILDGLTPGWTHRFRLVAVAGGDTAFGADTTFVTPLPNMRPETLATAGSLRDNPLYIYWTGSDPDGNVAGFRWRLSDGGVDGPDSAPDTLGLPWNFTTATDSVFLVTADQPDPSADPGDPGQPLFYQTHTFAIKAVDDRGAEDPTPAYFAFTATTEAPEVTVTISPTVGALPDGCVELPLPISLAWAASDPDSPADALLEVRTLLVSLADLGFDDCLTQAEFETLDPLESVDEELWSEWQEYDRSSHVLPTFDFGPGHVGGRYLFAAMARDAVGAWTVERAWGKNVWQVEVLAD